MAFRHWKMKSMTVKKEPVSFEREFLNLDEAKIMAVVALDVLNQRKIVRIKDGNYNK